MVDISPRMVGRAREAVLHAGVDERTEVLCEDIRDTTLEPETFDAVIACGTVLSDCGAPDAALRELAYVLAPGGVAAVSARNLHELLRREGEGVGGERRQDWLAEGRRLVPRGHQAFDWTFFSAGGLAAALRRVRLRPFRLYPVGYAPPPETAERIPLYVQLHLEEEGSEDALKRAHELLAVARKPEGA
jgi:SAM-dependent methyltransferase